MLLFIQILRGVAAVLVVLFHLITPERAWLQFGVDIFFVISGFVMVHSVNAKTMAGMEFFKNRLVRIVPLYWTVMAVYLAYSVENGGKIPGFDEIVKSFCFIFYNNSLNHQPTPLLTPGWTLNYEMYFYVLFALTIGMARGRQIALLAAVFTLAVAGRHWAPMSNALAFRLTSPVPLEFVAGMMLAHFRDRLPVVPPALGVVAVLCGFAAAILLNHPEPRVLFYGIPAIAIFYGAMNFEAFLAHPGFALFRKIGDASYSLYLTHPLSIMVLKKVYPGVGVIPGLIVAVLAAFAVYYGVEKPLTRGAKRLLIGQRPAPSVAS